LCGTIPRTARSISIRMASAARPAFSDLLAADVPGKAHVTFLFLFFSGEPDFFRV